MGLRFRSVVMPIAGSALIRILVQFAFLAKQPKPQQVNVQNLNRHVSFLGTVMVVFGASIFSVLKYCANGVAISSVSGASIENFVYWSLLEGRPLRSLLGNLNIPATGQKHVPFSG